MKESCISPFQSLGGTTLLKYLQAAFQWKLLWAVITSTSWPGIYISSFLVTLCVLQIFPKHFSKLPIHTIHLAKSIKSDSFSSLTFRCRPRRGLCSSRFPYTPLSSQAETPNLTSIKVSLGITSASVTISSNCTCLRFGLLWVLWEEEASLLCCTSSASSVALLCNRHWCLLNVNILWHNATHEVAYISVARWHAAWEQNMAILLIYILKTHCFSLTHESCTTNPVKGDQVIYKCVDTEGKQKPINELN